MVRMESGMSSTLHVRSVVASAFCVLDRYASERFGRLRSMRGEGASGVSTRIAGHAGRFKTLELVARNYWWPQMSRYIGVYVKTCDLCNQTKVQRRRPVGELHPSETPEAPWDTISVKGTTKNLSPT
jgi:hypothetical protein